LTVAQRDPENLLLTPFRTQNVPPPMSSGQLLVSASSEDRPKTPVHAALSAEKDVLAVLHEDGNYQVWDLQTRLGPGKGPVVEPVLLRKSQHDENKSYASWRQVELVGRPTLGDDVPWSVAMLGRRWNGGDVVTIRGASEDREISVEPGGRLLQSSPSGSIWWQSSTGVIQDREFSVPFVSSYSQPLNSPSL
jgi:elongator complex protein 1